MLEAGRGLISPSSWFRSFLPGDDPSPPAPGDASAEGNKTPFSYLELAGEASFSSYPTAL